MKTNLLYSIYPDGTHIAEFGFNSIYELLTEDGIRYLRVTGFVKEPNINGHWIGQKIPVDSVDDAEWIRLD